MAAERGHSDYLLVGLEGHGEMGRKFRDILIISFKSGHG